MPRFPFHIALIWSISMPDIGGTGCSLNIVLILRISSHDYIWPHDAPFIKYCVWDISMPYRCVLNIVLILSISSNYLKTKKSVVMWSHVYSWCHQKKPFSLYMTTLHDYTFINNYSFLFEVSPFDMTRLHMTPWVHMTTQDYTWWHHEYTWLYMTTQISC